MPSTPIPTPRRRYRTLMAWLRDFRYAPIRPVTTEEAATVADVVLLELTTEEGKEAFVFAHFTHTWHEIKTKLECHFCVDKQSLRLNGVHLDEGRKIAEWSDHLNPGTKIQLVPSLRGGALPKKKHKPERNHDKSFAKDDAWEGSLGYLWSAKESDVAELLATVKTRLEGYISRNYGTQVLKDVLKHEGKAARADWFQQAENTLTSMINKDVSSETIEDYLNRQVNHRLQDLLDLEEQPDIDIFADDDEQSSDEKSSDDCSTGEESSDGFNWEGSGDETTDSEDDEQAIDEIGTIDDEHKRAAQHDAGKFVDFRQKNDASCRAAADQAVLRHIRDICREMVIELDTRVTIEDLKKRLSEVLATIYASFHGLQARDMRAVMDYVAVEADKNDENYATEMARMRNIAIVLDSFAEDPHTENDEDRFHEDAVDIVNDACNTTKTAYHSDKLEKRLRWEYHATMVSLCLIFRVEPSLTVMVDKATKDETGGYSVQFTAADDQQYHSHQLLLSHLDKTEQRDAEDAVEEYRENCERNKQLVMPIACLNEVQISQLAATKAQIAWPIARMIEEGQETEKIREALNREDSDSEDDTIPFKHLHKVDEADASDYEDEATHQQLKNKQKLKELVDEQSGDPANKQISEYYVARGDLMERYYEQHEKVWKYLWARAHIKEHFLECTPEQFKVLVHAFAGNPGGVYRWGPCKGDRNEFLGHRTDGCTNLFHCDNCNGLCSLPGHIVVGFPTSQLLKTRGTKDEWHLYCYKPQPVVNDNDSGKRKRTCVQNRLQQGTTALRDTTRPEAPGSCYAFFAASKKAVLGDEKEATDATCYKKDIQDAKRDEKRHYIKQRMKTAIGKVYEEDKKALEEAICHVQQCEQRLAIQSADQVAYESDRAEFAKAAQAAEKDWQKAKHKQKALKAKLAKSKDAALQDLHDIKNSRAEGMDPTDPNACKLEMMNHSKQLRDGGYDQHPVLGKDLELWHKQAPNEEWVLQVDPWMNLNMLGGMTNMEIQFIDLEDEQEKADDTLTTLLAEHLMEHDTEIRMHCFAYECNDHFRKLILEKMEEDEKATLQKEFKKRVNLDARTVKTLRVKGQLDCFQVTDEFHLEENPDYMTHVIDAFNRMYKTDQIIVDNNEDGVKSNDVWSDLPRLNKGTVDEPEPMDEVKHPDSDDDLYGSGPESEAMDVDDNKTSSEDDEQMALEMQCQEFANCDKATGNAQCDIQPLQCYNPELMSIYFKIVDKTEVFILGDGRCFYWALQHALYWTSDESRKWMLKTCKGTVMGMRRLILDYANRPENSRADFTEEWKQKMLDPSDRSYACEYLEMQALATEMNIDIIVHQEDLIHRNVDDSLKTTTIKANSVGTDAPIRVHILKKISEHFNALVPFGKEKKAYWSHTYDWSNADADKHVNSNTHMEWTLSPQHLSITHMDM